MFSINLVGIAVIIAGCLTLGIALFLKRAKKRKMQEASMATQENQPEVQKTQQI